MRFRLVCQLLIGCLLFIVPAGCQQDRPPETLQLDGQTMGTTWSVILRPGPAGVDAAVLQQKLQQRLDRINRLMSTYDPQSEVSRFNDQATMDWFAISSETAEVIALSQEISRLTGGAFDISVGPLVELWGFGATARAQQIPTDRQIDDVLALVGYRNLHLLLEPPAIRKQVPKLRIDLSAVAKGYAGDALAELLEQQGLSNYLVEVGGELRIAGYRGATDPWRVAIEKPLEGIRDVARIIELSDTGLATSGNYRNFYIDNGQRYAHTLDPVSGRPVRHRLASVTVLDPVCARADALATALMVMGDEHGRRFCEQHGIAAYFLIHDKDSLTAYASPAFEAFVGEAKQ